MLISKNQYLIKLPNIENDFVLSSNHSNYILLRCWLLLIEFLCFISQLDLPFLKVCTYVSLRMYTMFTIREFSTSSSPHLVIRYQKRLWDRPIDNRIHRKIYRFGTISYFVGTFYSILNQIRFKKNKEIYESIQKYFNQNFNHDRESNFISFVEQLSIASINSQ